MNFSLLLNSIQQTHNALQQQAVKAINRSLTIRNWLIGYYIVEFEQKGEDRAKYGKRFLEITAAEIKKRGIKGLAAPELSRCRQFYTTYPQIHQAVSDELKRFKIYQTPSDVLAFAQASKQLLEMWGTAFPLSEEKILGTLSQESVSGVQGISGTVSQKSGSSGKEKNTLVVPADKLIGNLSFSHLIELIKIDDPLKRAYYELITIQNHLSVRELKKQINTLSFERTGLSKNKELSLQKIASAVQPQHAAEAIKDIYIFDFLNLPDYSGIEESDLETALLNHLQEFLIELGHGFCFEARQQKILIGDEYFFIDLVFYHRILKCHVLIDLKIEEFTHNNAGQLNTYLNYYKAEVAQPTDNPPVGILLVTDKNKALVEYATAGMDNKLFVSKYLVQLPSKEQLQQFVQNELKNL